MADRREGELSGFWKAFEQLSLAHPLDTLHTLLSRYSYLFHIVWSSGARIAHFRCLDGVWLRLFPEQLEAAGVKAQPDQHAFHLVLQALQRLQARAQEQGASVLVVFQPSKEETYLPLLGNAVPDLQHALQEALAQHGIAMLDLTPVFRHQAAIWSAALLYGRWLSQCTGPSIDRSQCVTSSHGTGTDQTG